MKWNLLFILLIFAYSSYAQQKMIIQQAKTPAISEESKAEMVSNIGELFESNYVFPEKGKVVNNKLKEYLGNGRYKDEKDLNLFLELIKKDIQSIIQDAHFNLIHFPVDRMMNWVNEDDSEETKEEAQNMVNQEAQIRNFGIAEVKILEGNIGYLNINSFNAPVEGAKPQLAAAFNLLQFTDALIIDMRQNGGGLPEYVSLVESYFFKKPTLLSKIYNRTSNTTTEYVTEENPGGQKYLDKKLYILTGPATGSGGEALPYNLQAFQKATVVGEGTIGGANGFTPIMLDFQDLGRLAVLMPDMRVENVRTKSNWENIGVKPDIEVPAKQALDMAHTTALKELMNASDSDSKKEEYAASISKIEYQIKKANSQSSSTNLEEYTGQFGIRKITLDGDRLLFSRENGPQIPLIETGEGKYELDIPLSPKPYIRFERGENGQITGFYLIQGGGEGIFNKKDN